MSTNPCNGGSGFTHNFQLSVIYAIIVLEVQSEGGVRILHGSMASPADRLLAKWRTRTVLRHLHPASTMVDLGCGSRCELLTIAVQQGLAIRGIGIDKVPISTPSSLAIEGIQTVLEEHLPFESSTVDVVTMLASIEHVDRPEALLSECLRILTNGGHLLLTTPAASGKWVLDTAARLRVIDAEQINDHKRYYTAKTLYQTLRASGFHSVRIRPFEFGFNLFADAQKLE